MRLGFAAVITATFVAATVAWMTLRELCCVTVHSQGDGTGAGFRFKWPSMAGTNEVKESANV
jgi:hypothetical protein